MARSNRDIVVANLDFESELAGVNPLKKAVVEFISAAASTLSVFCSEGAALWTPATLAPDRFVSTPPLLLAGDDQLPKRATSRLLAWGESSTIAARRASFGSHSGDLNAPTDWQSQLWQGIPTPGSARLCNHRSFAHDLARQRHVALPGARIVASTRELRDAIKSTATCIETTSATSSWVVKAAHSAAGRDRVRHRGGDLPSDRWTRVERLLERGSLLFEPWVQRLADFGVVGIVAESASGHRLFPPHRLELDSGGVFRGIVVGAPSLLTDIENAKVMEIARAATEHLHRANYRGPFGIDGFAYRDASGQRQLAPLSEINARLTFGHVARAHAERLEGTNIERTVRFALGRALPQGHGVTALLRPAAPDGLAIWLEVG